MNNGNAHFAVALSDAERVLASHLATLGGQGETAQYLNRSTIRQFLRDNSVCDRGNEWRLVLDNRKIRQWMIRFVKGRSLDTAYRRLAILNVYMSALVSGGFAPSNPIATFKAEHSNRSWVHLVPALQATDPDSALAALQTKPKSPGPLFTQIRSYLELQQSLGRKFEPQRYVLHKFDRFLQEKNVLSASAVTVALVKEWLDTLTCSSYSRNRYAQMVRRFFDHLVSRNSLSSNALTTLQNECRIVRIFRPFIFSHEQVAAILDKAQKLPKTSFAPFKGPTCYTFFALLYALGLRHGEARRLRIRDLDLPRQVVFIDRTKFYKSRYVPFGPKVGRCLQRFLEVRRSILSPLQPDDPLFVTLWRQPIDHHFFQDAFHGILRELGIVGGAGEGTPRLHDLRHSFAVHRLLRWYGEGVDVQSRLPLLSVFLGHLNPTSTEVYLTITTELLEEANVRFHRHFGSIFDGGEVPR